MRNLSFALLIFAAGLVTPLTAFSQTLGAPAPAFTLTDTAGKTVQLADYRGLKGDPSDNLSGVPGIGEKTAAKLIAHYGTLEEVLAHEPDAQRAAGEVFRVAHVEEREERRHRGVERRPVPEQRHGRDQQGSVAAGGAVLGGGHAILDAAPLHPGRAQIDRPAQLS